MINFFRSYMIKKSMPSEGQRKSWANRVILPDFLCPKTVAVHTQAFLGKWVIFDEKTDVRGGRSSIRPPRTPISSISLVFTMKNRWFWAPGGPNRGRILLNTDFWLRSYRENLSKKVRFGDFRPEPQVLDQNRPRFWDFHGKDQWNRVIPGGWTRLAWLWGSIVKIWSIFHGL